MTVGIWALNEFYQDIYLYQGGSNSLVLWLLTSLPSLLYRSFIITSWPRTFHIIHFKIYNNPIILFYINGKLKLIKRRKYINNVLYNKKNNCFKQIVK